MRADQHALKKAVRISLQVTAVFERARLALIAIDRHQPRAGFAKHRAPFASRRKTGAAQAAQARVVERFQQVLFREVAGAETRQQLIPATGNVSVVVHIFGQMRVGIAGFRRSEDSSPQI